MNLQQTIDELLDAQQSAGLLSQNAGVAAAVVRDGDVSFVGTWGLRDRERRLPVTPRTIFGAASITKSLTATALAMAEARGLVTLDQRLNARGDLFPLADPDVAARVTLADVLAHRTGLPAHDVLWYLGTPTAASLVAALPHLELLPGGYRRTFLYNNLAYGVLGARFPELVGAPWDRFVAENVLAPAGMTRSSFAYADDEDLALPYVGDARAPGKDLSVVAASSALRTTIEDLARWVRFQLVSPDLAHLHAAQIPIVEQNPLNAQGVEWLAEDAAYGMGWFLGRAAGRRVLYHTGFMDGFSAAVAVVPQDRLAFAVLTNVTMSPVPGAIVARLFEATTGAAIARPPAPPAPVAAPLVASPRVLSAPDAVAGLYRDPAYGELEVRASGGDAALHFRDRVFPLAFTSKTDAVFELDAMGMRIPLPAFFDEAGVSIPFALDPRVPLRRFVRA